ncbi:MAG: PorV/PorQ family protein [bacterium]
MSRIPLGAAGLVLLGLSSAAAADDPSTVGFSFLTLGTGPRLEALGRAGTAIADGTDALIWNPALLARNPHGEVAASGFNWLADVQSGNLTAQFPLGGSGLRAGSFALGVRALGVDDFTNVTGEAAIGQTDLAVDAGIGVPLGSGVSAGLGTRMLRSSLAGDTATGFAFDGGLNFRWSRGWNLAAAVRDAGSAVGYVAGHDEQLPTEVALGVGGTVGSVRFGLDSVFPNGQASEARLGGEYALGQQVLLRAGGRIGGEADQAHAAWAVGFGLKPRPDVTLDYSFRDGDLNPSHRIGLRWAFGATSEPETAAARSPREFYSEVLEEAIERGLADFPRDVRDTVVVQVRQEHAAASTVTDAVVAHLRNLGIAAVAKDPVAELPPIEDPDVAARAAEAMEAQGYGAPDSPWLRIDVRESVYEITRTRRDRWIGPKSVDRAARVDLLFTLRDPDAADDRWTGTGTAARAELVAADLVPTSEGYPPASGGNEVGAKKMHPLVEPAIVGGIVAGLAAIFFSNREVGQ